MTLMPSWKSDKFLVGKLSKKRKKELHKWRLENEPGYREMVEGMAARNALIVKAQRRGLLAWAMDPGHYRNGSPYCKCGTVEQHNARHDEVLAGVARG